MTAEGYRANVEDLCRLFNLECDGYFEFGFTARAVTATARYVATIIWLKLKRELPGAPPYPGPRQA